MATQVTLNNAIAMLKDAMSTVTFGNDTGTYWTGLLNKPYTLHSDGTVQSTMSNPLAYFVVPLAGDGTRGRSHSFTLDQFCFALTQNWTTGAHVKFRGVNALTISKGLAFNRARLDSELGTVLARKEANKLSANKELGVKVKKGLGETLERIDNTPTINGRVIGMEVYQNSIAAAILASNKPAKPAKATKPAKPASVKPATRKPRAA